MGTAILPAQDCLASSYKANKNRHSTGKAYHHVSSLQSENDSVHAHRILGNSPDIYRRKADPKWLQNYVPSNMVSSGRCNRIWSSPSSRASVDPENIYFLKRPLSTPPRIDVDGALLGDSFSIFNCQRPFASYSSTNSSGQRFGNSLQQSVSTRHYFHDPKHTMGNIVHAEAKGRRGGQYNKNLVMEKVTILKRGETIKNAVGKDPDKRSQVRQKSSSHSSDRVIVNNVETRLSSLKRNKTSWASRTVSKVSGDESKTNQDPRYTDCEDINLPEMIDDLNISTDPLGPDPSVLPKEGSGILQSVSSGVKASEAMGNELPKMLKEFQSVSFEGVDYSKVGNPSSSGFASPVFESEKWAGPAYSNSPPPSSLPFPKFYMQTMRSIAMDLIDANQCSNNVEVMDSSLVSPSEDKVHPPLPIAPEKAQSTFTAVRSCSNSLQFGVDTSATQDLRRLLGLD